MTRSGVTSLIQNSLSHGKLCLRYSRIQIRCHLLSRTERLNTSDIISHGTESFRVKPITPDHPISQDFNWPDHFLRGYLKDRVCKNNPQTREDIIRKDRAAAVLSYRSVVYGTSTILITGKV